jgi:glyoxylase-like metal-dependent hydrolase (beta-lactamase superfamily II)
MASEATPAVHLDEHLGEVDLGQPRLEELLIDAGTYLDRGRILKQLAGRTLSAHALTHAHFDHYGSSRLMCERFGIPLWCGAGDVEMVQRRLPAPLDLQMPLEVARRVITPPRVSDRHPGLGPSGEPGTIGADMLAVCIPGPDRQRRPLQISRVALDRRRDRLVADALLVSRRRFRSL